MFQPSTNLLEIVVRVLVVYAGLFLLLRLAGKKELGQLAPMDFLAMLIISETVSPALTKQDTSLSAGLVAAATLVGVTFLTDWLTYRSKRLARVLDGKAQTLIADGHVVRTVQRREKITDGEIDAALRREGVDDVADVKRAVVETTGRISVIRK